MLDELKLQNKLDAEIPFTPCEIVAECFECGSELDIEHYVYVKDGKTFCSFCEPDDAEEILGEDL